MAKDRDLLKMHTSTIVPHKALHERGAEYMDVNI